MISVVIPVYNAEATLTRCLDALLAQTYRDFEVICVDDGSTDKSLESLRRYEGATGGKLVLRIVSQPNAGTFAARKQGVKQAQGDHVCFVDPDDSVKPRFLEKLVKTAATDDWDIVQCGVELEETRIRTARERAVSERYFNPDAPTLRDGGLLTQAYVRKRIGWNLIFRLFKASLVKEAFAELPDVNMINETDAAAFFGIAARARSFKRISDRLYVYRYGEGISTRLDYSIADFRRTLGKFDFLRGYVPRVRGDEAETAFVSMARRMCENSRKSACTRLPAGDVRQAALGDLHRAFKGVPRPVRHVGIHYFNLHIGGVQRVLLQEVAVLRELGVRVTLFLEDESDAESFAVPDGVSVRRFPRSQGNVPEAEERIPRVIAAMRESGIDCWYDHAVFAPAFAEDLCVAKWLLNMPVWAHYHTVFTAPLRFRIHPEYYELQAHWLRIADCTFALGAADAAYFVREGVAATVLPNALPAMCRAVLEKKLPRPRGHRIIWCGRRSWEKHPEDAEKIVAQVRQQVPDAELDMVTNEPDPYPHYACASVFLSTSEMEGFSMTSVEALSHGLPVVAYRLDNLDLYQDNPAVFQVPPRDCQAAAAAIAAIWNRPDGEALRGLAQRSLEKLAGFDHTGFWRRMVSGHWPSDLPEIAPVMLERVRRLEEEGLCYRRAHPHVAGKDKLSWRRVRRYIRDNGFWYTVKKAVSKVLWR